MRLGQNKGNVAMVNDIIIFIIMLEVNSSPLGNKYRSGQLIVML